MSEKIMIAVTGGPSGGKTTLLDTLKKDLSKVVAVVPEAASILYRGGFPRKKTVISKRSAQRSIYFVQKELETLFDQESTNPLIVCDRGSLDSLAYWPAKPEDFFESLNTNKKTELERYHWVIHLDTAAQENFDTTNPVRIETHSEALELNHLIMQAWEGHPNRLVIPHCDEFLQKINAAKRAILMISKGASLPEVQKSLQS